MRIKFVLKLKLKHKLALQASGVKIPHSDQYQLILRRQNSQSTIIVNIYPAGLYCAILLMLAHIVREL